MIKIEDMDDEDLIILIKRPAMHDGRFCFRLGFQTGLASRMENDSWCPNEFILTKEIMTIITAWQLGIYDRGSSR